METQVLTSRHCSEKAAVFLHFFSSEEENQGLLQPRTLSRAKEMFAIWEDSLHLGTKDKNYMAGGVSKELSLVSLIAGGGQRRGGGCRGEGHTKNEACFSNHKQMPTIMATQQLGKRKQEPPGHLQRPYVCSMYQENEGAHNSSWFTGVVADSSGFNDFRILHNKSSNCRSWIWAKTKPTLLSSETMALEQSR